MFEKIIFQNIISNEKYGVCFIPFLKKEYFQLAESKVIFNHISEYFTSFKTVPHHNEVAISIGNDTSLSEDMFTKTISLIDEIKTPDDYNFEWLESETKKWIRNKAFEQVIVESAERLGSNKPIDDMMDKVKEKVDIINDEKEQKIDMNQKKKDASLKKINSINKELEKSENEHINNIMKEIIVKYKLEDDKELFKEHAQKIVDTYYTKVMSNITNKKEEILKL